MNLETQLFNSIFENISEQEMNKITKYFIIPIGLPGMGKTTLSRFLQNYSSQKINFTNNTIILNFQKISYDRILTSNQKSYCALHPDVGMHEAIDIIREKAD